MKRLLVKIIILLFPVAILILLPAIVLPPSNSVKNRNHFALIDKHKLLLNTPRPRIIFVGGSNISFGLNSQMIMDSLKINPINMGIHAGIGLKFMLNDVSKYLQAGDILVVVPEYHQFYGNVAEGDITLLSIVIDVVHSIEDLDIGQVGNLFRYLPEYSSSKLKVWNYFYHVDTLNPGIVDRRSFNKCGDAYIHWSLPVPGNVPPMMISGALNKTIFAFLNKYVKQMDAKKVRVYFSYPGYQEAAFKKCIKQISEIEYQFKQNKYSLVGTPHRYQMNDSLLFNTAYHLNKKGVDYHTSLLIQDLRSIIDK